jgi:prevent-host-death family protein
VRTVNIHEARTHFSKLIDAVLRGDEIFIAMAGRPVAKLGPIRKKRRVKFGVLKGKIKIPKDFDAPLGDETLNAFEA